MKKGLKFLILAMACMMIFSILFTGCGSKGTDDLSVKEDGTQQAKADIQTDKPKQEGTQDTGKQATVAGEKKKMAIVQETIDPYNDGAHKNIIAELKQNGFEGQNIDIQELYLAGDQKKSPEEILKIIKESKPDVVFFLNGYDIMKQLAGTDIPCICYSTVENYVDENGKPKQNITGIYTMPKDMKKRAYEFLNKIVPNNGKKAVFVTVDGFFKKEDIASALKAVNVELKDYCESKYIEDYQAAVNKYNKDNEVGWILVGVWPWTKKDGSAIPQTEMAKWDTANRKKPTVTYWDVAVGMGLLCGLGVDIPAEGIQQGKMAARILKGEKIQDIKAEEPAKINIALNKKRADALGIQFPADILGSAYRVYTDYEGNYLK